MNVEELLTKKKIPFTPKGQDFVVKCLNPEHDESNPSMRIDKTTGIFQCFSCGYKGNIFYRFGERPNGLQIRRDLLKKKILELRADSHGLPHPKNSMPYHGNWRNIRKETYEEFGAFLNEDIREMSGRIMFPISNLTGNTVAFIGRKTTLDGGPKYLNYPAGAKMPLYPQVTPIAGSIILVEGIFDMINLHDKGITNAVCCFGVRNVNEEKLSIYQMKGIDKLICFFDNDDAGNDAAEQIREMCEKINLQYQRLRYGDKEQDAGSLTQRQVTTLYDRLFN